MGGVPLLILFTKNSRLEDPVLK